jgi:hypothetical protein
MADTCDYSCGQSCPRPVLLTFVETETGFTNRINFNVTILTIAGQVPLVTARLCQEPNMGTDYLGRGAPLHLSVWNPPLDLCASEVTLCGW